MGCEEFGERLLRERKMRNWSQAAFGIFLAKRSSQLGRRKPPIPISTVSRWENGHQWPDGWHAYCICSLLGRAAEALALESVLTPSAIVVIEASIPSREQVDSRGEVGRKVRQLSETLAVGGPPGTIDRERMSYVLLGGAVDGPAALDLRRLTDVKLAQRGRIATRLLLRELNSHLVMLEEALPNADSDDVRRDLVIMAGETTTAAAQALYTLFDFGASQQFCAHARAMAHELGGAAVLAMANITEALLYVNRLHGIEEGLSGGASRAVELLDAAESAVGPGAPPHLAMVLYAQRSWELAGAGYSVAAERDLDAAQRALSRWTEPPSEYWSAWDETYLSVARGKTALMLGRVSDSVGHFERALTTTKGWMTPLYEVQLAAALANAGQPERAGSLLLGVLDDARAKGTTVLLSRIDKLAGTDLAGYRDVPVVRELQERLAAA
jgi:transcriptional regulator with XRE-family HTH domain